MFINSLFVYLNACLSAFHVTVFFFMLQCSISLSLVKHSSNCPPLSQIKVKTYKYVFLFILETLVNNINVYQLFISHLQILLMWNSYMPGHWLWDVHRNSFLLFHRNEFRQSSGNLFRQGKKLSFASLKET